ncbi:MAG: dehydrogenase [Bacteroidales bacterium]|nr:dehydrogenase [Bacteroidales bacterium]
MNLLYRSLLIVLLLTVYSCGTRQAAPSQEDRQDSIVQDTDTLLVDVMEPFPDTMMPSAEKVMFKIDTFDQELSPMLSDLHDLYDNASGIFTFRGSLSRNPNFFGRLHGDTVNINVDWVFTTHSDTTHTTHGVWGGGTGWTGQPLYIHWPDSLMDRMQQPKDSLLRLSNQELVVASLCGKVYFIDFNTGNPTRMFFNAKNVLKGTPSFNPLFNGDLYIGHGVPKHNPFGHVVFNLYTEQQTQAFGKDRTAWRGWNAYDSSPIVVGGFLFRPGENGTLYKYHVGEDSIQLHSTFRYSLSRYHSSPGIESSMAVCRNYGYLNDNAGNILCVNLNTLKPVWHYHNHDDSDATPVVDMEDGIPYVYSGCEVDRQGATGVSYFVKLNGLTGEKIWEDTIRGRRIQFNDKKLDAGMFGSPLLGGGDCSDLIFSNFCINTLTEKGCLVAFDKHDGTIRYKTMTQQYSWSSPVAFYNDNDEMFLFTGDGAGYVYLIKGSTGEIVASKRIGSNFESSPIVVDDKIIIGSRGNKIFRISLE